MKKLYKSLTICALCIVTFSIQAQEIKRMTKLNTFDIGYGQKFLQKDFYGQLGSYSSQKIFQPLTYIGFGGISGFARNKKSFYSGHLYYQQVIPQNITIADTINGKITGFNLGFTLIGQDLLGKSERFDLLVGLGINTGRLRMYKNELIRQKNPYFSPKISLTPRARLGKVVISLNLDYEFGHFPSGMAWKTIFANANKVNIQNLRQTGFQAFLTVGRFIGDSSQKASNKAKRKKE